MKVGLIRHFKVKIKMPEKKLVTPDDVYLWFDEYDKAEVEDGEIDLCGVEWNKCFSSDLPRAVKTAEKICGENLIMMKELRELQLDLLTEKRIRLPFTLWAAIFRIKTFISRELMADFKKQIAKAVDHILVQNEENVLVVSHSFAMIYLRKELVNRGFAGPSVNNPVNGKLYVFEK